MNKRKNISIKDVARESQASLTTVSLVLNKRDRRISLATRNRILETAQRLGYQPSRLAQGLQARRSGCLAILVPQLRHAFADAYFGELIGAIHDCASQAGYKILLEVAHPEFIRDQKHLELFDRRFVDGMLCLGVTNRDTYLREFEDGSRPVIVVNNYLPGYRLSHVRCDYHEAGRMAAEYLLGLGHKNIGLIHGASEVQTTHDFQDGVEEALGRAKCGLAPRRVEDGLFTVEGGASAAVELLSREPSITALIAGNDKMAIGALAGLNGSGRRVPQDVSVVGCDDVHQAAFCDPPLTTVHTSIYDLGELACRRLLDIIDGRESSIEDRLPVRLTVRASSAAPRHSQN